MTRAWEGPVGANFLCTYYYYAYSNTSRHYCLQSFLANQTLTFGGSILGHAIKVIQFTKEIRIDVKLRTRRICGMLVWLVWLICGGLAVGPMNLL